MAGNPIFGWLLYALDECSACVLVATLNIVLKSGEVALVHRLGSADGALRALVVWKPFFLHFI